MKKCNQNPNQSDIDRVAKELKFEAKTHYTYEEALAMAKKLWVTKQPNQQKLTQDQKDCKKTY
jgi:hypothetical protein